MLSETLKSASVRFIGARAASSVIHGEPTKCRTPVASSCSIWPRRIKSFSLILRTNSDCGLDFKDCQVKAPAGLTTSTRLPKVPARYDAGAEPAQ